MLRPVIQNNALGGLNDDLVSILQTMNHRLAKLDRELLNDGMLFEVLQQTKTNGQIFVSKSPADALHGDGVHEDMLSINVADLSSRLKVEILCQSAEDFRVGRLGVL